MLQEGTEDVALEGAWGDGESAGLCGEGGEHARVRVITRDVGADRHLVEEAAAVGVPDTAAEAAHQVKREGAAGLDLYAARETWALVRSG